MASKRFSRSSGRIVEDAIRGARMHSSLQLQCAWSRSNGPWAREHRVYADGGESVWPRRRKGGERVNEIKKKKSGGPGWIAIGPSSCRGHACLYVCAAPRTPFDGTPTRRYLHSAFDFDFLGSRASFNGSRQFVVTPPFHTCRRSLEIACALHASIAYEDEIIISW